DLKGIALENFADAARLNDFGSGSNILCDCAHGCPLILILSPSFNVAGAEVTMVSPPTRPSTSAPSARWLVMWTSRATTLPLYAMKTAFFPSLSRIAVVGTNTPVG